MKTFKEWSEAFYDKISVPQINSYLRQISRLISNKDLDKLLRKKFNLKKIKWNPAFTKILAVEEYISEEITKNDLNQIEKYADKLFAAVGIDVEFTRHFLDRVNDARNKKPINSAELIRLFRLTYKKYGKKIAKMSPDAEAVFHDMETDVNMPFVLNLDKDGMLDLVAKTVMRKKDFKTRNQKLEI